MYDTAKYLIHANITAKGVVERSDVVGAIFGQTEGLLGDELDLRDLQDSSKVGRIDVEISSESGQSFGTVTIASGLDQVETAILGASLETIERVGPCRAAVEVDRIEDVRAAKRRQIVERAKTLLGSAFDGGILTSDELVEEVRRSIRIEDITEYKGLPAGPRVADSDAIIVVEGRSDVLTLLQYGIKNAIGVQGTSVPDAVASLTTDKTVTAFFDGDRGGDLLLKELGQVASIDFVAMAPTDDHVEDLSRNAVMKALREKIPADSVSQHAPGPEELAATDGSARPAPPPTEGAPTPDAPLAEPTATAGSTPNGATTADPTPPDTLSGHVTEVVEAEGHAVRLLDASFETIADGSVDEAFTLLKSAGDPPACLIIDGALTQRVLDIAAQTGVGQIVTQECESFVKQPTSVRVRTVGQVTQSSP